MNNSRNSLPTPSCLRRRICAPWILLLLLLALPAAVHAQFNYVITNGTITITGYTGPGGALTIPSSINGLPVTAIGGDAFDYCSSLTSVIIPSGVVTIGSYAFIGCTSMTNVTIPNSVTDIGRSAFYACTSLASLTIPNSITGIHDYTFWACRSLTSVTIPNSVTGIGNAAFGACTNLTSVTIPGRVRYIGSQAFMDCFSLAGVTIPASVTTIGDGAFASCSRLASVTIPSSVTSIGANAFGRCPELTAITVDALNPAYSSTDGVLFNRDLTMLAQYPGAKSGSYTVPNSVTSIASYAFAGCAGLTSVVIPNSVTSIGNCAFQGCTSLSSVSLPNSVVSISDHMFHGCTSLTTLAIPDSVTKVGEYAFNVCTNLASVTIPNRVTSIGICSFQSCSSLASVTIGDSLTNIGVFAFSSCNRLNAITVSAANSTYSSAEGVLFNKSQTVLIACPGGKAGSYTVPNSVHSIGDMAFNTCTGLTNVIIGNSVADIGSSAFMHCINVITVAMGSGISNIGNAAFYDCPSLSAITVDALNPAYASVQGVLFNKSQTVLIACPEGKAGSYTVPNGVTSIGEAAFRQCSSLTNVTIAVSVTSLGNYAFKFCASLTGIYFLGNAPASVASAAFEGLSNLTVYYLPGTTGWGTTFGGRPTALWPPPTVQRSPQTQTAEAGSAVSLRVQASSPLPLFYLWYFNHTNLISLTTNRGLALTGVRFSQSGTYTVVISNVLGAITSAPAMLQVIAPVQRAPVPGLKVTGEAGSLLNVDYADSLSPAPSWTTLGSLSLASTSQYYFDLSLPLQPQRFYRAHGIADPPVFPVLDLHMVPAITVTGIIGGSVRVDCINQFGPTDAWVTLETVTLTNTSQLYFDVSAPGQPQRLYRLVQVP